MALARSEREYLPAAGHDWFLPLYDPLTKLLGMDGARQILLEQAALDPGLSVLDVGCGTGTLAVMIKQLHPTIHVIAVDPDPKALARARRKADRASVAIRFDQGYGDALPHPDGRFDRVFSSMMFHHVPADDQPRMLREIRRVLKPRGRLELLDFAGPDSNHQGTFARLIHSHHQLEGNSEGRILQLMKDAGFAEARLLRTQRRIFGRLNYFQAVA